MQWHIKEPLPPFVGHCGQSRALCSGGQFHSDINIITATILAVAETLSTAKAKPNSPVTGIYCL